MKKHIMLALLTSLACQSLFANTTHNKILGGQPASTASQNVASLIYKPGKEALLSEGDPNPVMQAHVCGATMLSPNWVMTTAHCVDIEFDDGSSLTAADLEVLAGAPNIGETAPDSELLLPVDAIFLHPDYVAVTETGQTPNHDIALLKLATPADFTNNDITSTVLANINDLNKLESLESFDETVMALGWGAVELVDETTTLIPSYLQSVALDYVPTADCQDAYGGALTESLLCANETTPDEEDAQGEDTCFGDSGGPLYFTSTSPGNNPQVGIISGGWASQCQDPNYPGYYTNVANYLEWIETVTADHELPLHDLSLALTHSDGLAFDLTVSNESQVNTADSYTLILNHSENTILATDPELDCATNTPGTQTVCEGSSLSAQESTAFSFTTEYQGTSSFVSMETKLHAREHADYRRTDNTLLLQATITNTQEPDSPENNQRSQNSSGGSGGGGTGLFWLALLVGAGLLRRLGK